VTRKLSVSLCVFVRRFNRQYIQKVNPAFTDVFGIFQERVRGIPFVGLFTLKI
jgi:hypothetical protein